MTTKRALRARPTTTASTDDAGETPDRETACLPVTTAAAFHRAPVAGPIGRVDRATNACVFGHLLTPQGDRTPKAPPDKY